MADAKDEKCWTNHAAEHEDIKEYDIPDEAPLRSMLLGLRDVKTVVDLGCGSSLWRHMFDGFDYIGIDQNEAMISVAKKRFPEDRFEVCNGKKLTVLEDESVDLVFTAAVLQHNLHPEKAEVVKEIVRVLKPGGYYLCTENTFREDNCHHNFGKMPWHAEMDDGYTLTSVGWEKFMKPLGLTMVRFSPPSEYIYIKE